MSSHSEPTTAAVEKAFAMLGRLISRGADPQLLADGKVTLGGPATARESQWCRDNRDAFRAALVGAGRYVAGSLDRIYEIERTAPK